MDCREVRPRLLDFQRGRLDAALRGNVSAHLAGCADCAHEHAAEQALTGLLERGLPQHPASLALKRRIAQAWPEEAPPKESWWRRMGPALVPALAAVAVVLLVGPTFLARIALERSATAGMVSEAVNDHLRVLHSAHPIEVESGNMHQVKPWFAGKLDFAPAVSFLGDDEFPLKGGAIGYYFDREAAVFVYAHRLHKISLFVFRAEGLRWPSKGLTRIGDTQVRRSVERGFNVILWHSGELGYAMVSDSDMAALLRLAGRIVGRAPDATPPSNGRGATPKSDTTRSR